MFILCYFKHANNRELIVKLQFILEKYIEVEKSKDLKYFEQNCKDNLNVVGYCLFDWELSDLIRGLVFNVMSKMKILNKKRY